MVTIAEQEEAYITKACLAPQSLGLQAASACQYRHSIHRGRKRGKSGRKGGKEGQRERGRQTDANIHKNGVSYEVSWCLVGH